MTVKRKHSKHRVLYHDVIHADGDIEFLNSEVSDKLWGSEHLVTNSEKYCVKVMTIKPGTQVSMHFHLKKEETFVVISGQLIIETLAGRNGKKSFSCLHKVGDAITLKPGTPHTFYCPKGQIESTVFLEASTQDFADDSYRIYPSKTIDSGGSDS